MSGQTLRVGRGRARQTSGRSRTATSRWSLRLWLRWVNEVRKSDVLISLLEWPHVGMPFTGSGHSASCLHTELEGLFRPPGGSETHVSCIGGSFRPPAASGVFWDATPSCLLRPEWSTVVDSTAQAMARRPLSLIIY